MSEINTEGKFKFRIKPNIEHSPSHINRAIQEIQEIIVANQQSAEDYKKEIADLRTKLDVAEAKIEALKELYEEQADGKTGSDTH